MARIEYSQIARLKLFALKDELTLKYGIENAMRTISKIMSGIRRLENFTDSGVEISGRFDLETDYRYIFLCHNYIFYRVINVNTVIILDMLNEKEDFMKTLFGVNTISQENSDYWDE